MSSRSIVLAVATVAVTLACGPAPVMAAGRTIVGDWSPNPRMCRPMDGALKIVPLGMAGDEFSCNFKSVARSGDVVTWRGSCGFTDGTKAATVVAALSGETLSLRINGNDFGSYRRCRPGSGMQG